MTKLCSLGIELTYKHFAEARGSVEGHRQAMPELLSCAALGSYKLPFNWIHHLWQLGDALLTSSAPMATVGFGRTVRIGRPAGLRPIAAS